MSSRTVKKLHEKLSEEKGNHGYLVADREFYDLALEILGQRQEEGSIENKIRNLELKLEKMLIAAVIKHKVRKISKILSMSTSNRFYLEALYSIEGKLAKKLHEKLSLIKIDEDIPAVIGEDDTSYGPFRKNDIAYISERFSSLLIKKKLARSIGDESP